MRQWFIRFSEFPEFSENFVPFREKPKESHVSGIGSSKNYDVQKSKECKQKVEVL